METVLVVGSSGNIGVSVIIAALRTGRQVLAVVRRQSGVDKIKEHVGSLDGITTVEADLIDADGVQNVEQVRQGKLPASQHVYSAVGIYTPQTPMYEVPIEDVRRMMRTNFGANFRKFNRGCLLLSLSNLYYEPKGAYRSTMPYLIEQRNPNSTWTLIIGSAGELGTSDVIGISQGALFSMANAVCRETKHTNVRFNEVYLDYRVELDSVAEKLGIETRIKSSEFAAVYETISKRPDIHGCQLRVHSKEDVTQLHYKEKVPL